MSIELNKEFFSISEEKCSGMVQSINESDIIVPDSKPDAVSIVDVSAFPYIAEKYITKDYITLTGTVNYKILYLGDNDSIEAISYSSPFSKQIDAKGVDDSMNSFINCKTSHIEHSVINSRKINVKSVVSISAKAYSKRDFSLISDVSSDSPIPLKKASVNNFCPSVFSQESFSIEDSVKLSSGPDNIDEILKYEMSIKESEIKVVINKVVVKGNALISTLYKNENEIYSFENEIPFSQIFDVEGIAPEMYTKADFDILNVSCERNLDNDGTMSIMDIKADISVLLKSYDENRFDYISDVYSPDYNIDVEKQSLKVAEMVDIVTTQCTVNDIISFEEDFRPERVYSMDSSLKIDDVVIKGNNVNVTGTIMAKIMCKGAEESPYISTSAKNIPFSCVLPVGRGFEQDNAKTDCKGIIEHQSYTLDGINDVKVRFVVKIECSISNEYEIEAVTEISADESKKIDKSDQAGITVYFVQNGDSMWDIAKRYHTTYEEIASVNNLDSDELHIEQQLLIPKRGKF